MTVVVGAGQAGLAVSRELTVRGVEHTVLERGRIGETWRGRWDAFCLVTPNWTVTLPGGEYRGPDPDGYMSRDEVVTHLEGYARSFAGPVREGVAVTAVAPASSGLLLSTSDGPMRAETVVLTTGAYQKAHRPAGAGSLPTRLQVIDAEGYRSPGGLAPGKVLVVGSGQTGCQLSEELHQAGREAFLACGRAPWMPRRLGDRDLVHWVVASGFMDQARSTLPSPQVRLIANVQASGHDGGHDLHYRTLRRMGVTLLGHFVGAENGRARFAPDLAQSVAFGDARYADLCKLIRESCARRGEAAPPMPEPEPFVAESPETIDLTTFGAVIFTSGFRPDYRSWVQPAAAFDELGFPLEEDGASTVVPGLYFCGVHFMRTRKSSLLLGVGEDAAIVARSIAARRGASRDS